MQTYFIFQKFLTTKTELFTARKDFKMSFNERFKQLAKEKQPRPEPQRKPKIEDAKKSMIYSLCAFGASCLCFIPFAFIVFFVCDLVLLRFSLVHKENYVEADGPRNKFLIIANVFCIISTTLAIILTVYAVLITYAMIF